MKALSISQPWAWAILHHGKDIENRNWSTKVRGTILIHVPKTLDPIGLLELKKMGIIDPALFDSELIRGVGVGGFVGTVDIVDCVTQHESKWFRGIYGFVLANPCKFDYLEPWSGRLGFFEVPFEHLTLSPRRIFRSKN